MMSIVYEVQTLSYGAAAVAMQVRRGHTVHSSQSVTQEHNGKLVNSYAWSNLSQNAGVIITQPTDLRTNTRWLRFHSHAAPIRCLRSDATLLQQLAYTISSFLEGSGERCT